MILWNHLWVICVRSLLNQQLSEYMSIYWWLSDGEWVQLNYNYCPFIKLRWECRFLSKRKFVNSMICRMSDWQMPSKEDDLHIFYGVCPSSESCPLKRSRWCLVILKRLVMWAILFESLLELSSARWAKWYKMLREMCSPAASYRCPDARKSAETHFLLKHIRSISRGAPKKMKKLQWWSLSGDTRVSVWFS